jgi:cytochrome c biogenesis protein CcmG/thiol:disulfide interchange protein DsbE
MVAVGLAATATWSNFQLPQDGPLAGKPAPSFTVSGLDGSTLTLSDLMEPGRPIVVSFWATWCGSCGQQAAELTAFASANQVPVAAIAIHDNPEDVEAHWGEQTSGVTVAVDESGSLTEDYEAVGLPVTYIISAEGDVIHQVSGLVRARTLERLLDG